MKKTDMIYILGSGNDTDIFGAYKDWHDALDNLFEMAMDMYCVFYDEEKVTAECEERAYNLEKGLGYLGFLSYLWADIEERTPLYIQQVPLM